MRTALVALLLIGLAGCGGSSSSSSSSQAEKAQQAALDFARCMRAHGVNVADPKPGAGDLSFQVGGSPGSRTKLSQADAACRHFLKGAMQAPKPADQQRIVAAALKWAACMRRHGVSVPDPKPAQGGAIKIGPGPQANPNDPAFQHADRQCQSLLPGPGPAATANGGGHSGGTMAPAP